MGVLGLLPYELTFSLPEGGWLSSIHGDCLHENPRSRQDLSQRSSLSA